MVTKVLIVDDSALMRRQLSQIFDDSESFKVELARNGAQALELNQSFEPDVITLDINMPEMDGLTALSNIMVERPCPVIMVSSLTERGALATFEALALGAVDYVAKPGGTISLTMDEVREDLLAKVRAAAGSKVARAPRPQPAPVVHKPEPVPEPAALKAREVANADEDIEGLVIVGVSTGGPNTLEDILPHLPPDFPYPIVIAQHMPGAFTAPFANRLDRSCPLNVLEAEKTMPLARGNVYIAKGSADVVIVQRGGRLVVSPRPQSEADLWHPSVELLGESVLKCCNPEAVIGLMLTGMGSDGSDSFTALREQGARTIAESEDTAIVFGMPRELIQKGGATLTLPKDKIANQLVKWTRSNKEPRYGTA